MALNVVGLVVLLVFYLIILITGLLASRIGRRSSGTSALEESVVAGRRINTVVGIFTMTATMVGGGFINGAAESIATSGLVWTLAPFGIFLGLITGGLVFARRLREQKYLTMLDPFQLRYGNLATVLLYLASLCADLFWTASILSALGTSLSVILNIDLTVAIVTSASVTICYTMIGHMKAVAYTDIVQLCFIIFGLCLSFPFAVTNSKVGDITDNTDLWIGTFDTASTLPWLDLFIAMIFGTIPWQSYIQRILAVQSGRQAQLFSVVAGSLSLVLVIPSIVIGATAVNADWTNTTLGMSPMSTNKSSMVLPYVLHEFTPPGIAIVGLGAICAAVMSSMDSSILGSSSMLTNNIYKAIFRSKASDRELQWVQRISILSIGTTATVISIFVPVVYGLFVLAADIVFVIILPQLFCVVFIPWTNGYGSVVGFITGTILRIGAGESLLDLRPFIYYPWYSEDNGQGFPFRTFAALCSAVALLLISLITKRISMKEKPENSYNLSTINSNIVDPTFMGKTVTDDQRY